MILADFTKIIKEGEAETTHFNDYVEWFAEASVNLEKFKIGGEKDEECGATIRQC